MTLKNIKCISPYTCFFKINIDECKAINLKCEHQSRIIDINNEYKP